MDKITLSLTAVENILMNKHSIKLLPIIDSQNEKHIELIGNELRTIKRYPVGYDFLVNVIDKIKDKVARSINDISSDYYELNVLDETFTNYLKPCGNHAQRQSLARQLVTDMTSGFVYIKGKGYIGYQAPFRIMGRKIYSDGKRIYQVHLLKQVFDSLIKGECYKNGGDGYIEIPSMLFPIITRANKGILQSYNPIYKLNIFGIKKNTHKKKNIEVNRNEFLKTVLPEYYKNGYLTKDIYSIRESLSQAAKEVSKSLPNHHNLVKNFYLGHREGNSTIYFNSCKE